MAEIPTGGDGHASIVGFYLAFHKEIYTNCTFFSLATDTMMGRSLVGFTSVINKKVNQGFLSGSLFLKRRLFLHWRRNPGLREVELLPLLDLKDKMREEAWKPVDVICTA